MASWTERILGMAMLGCAAGCTGNGSLDDSGDLPAECADSPWTWQNTGEPFARTWCTSCHHSDLGAGARQGAPLDVNLETYSAFMAWADRTEARVWNESSPMPPVGIPPEGDLLALEEWLACGAPE